MEKASSLLLNERKSLHHRLRFLRGNFLPTLSIVFLALTKGEVVKVFPRFFPRPAAVWRRRLCVTRIRPRLKRRSEICGCAEFLHNFETIIIYTNCQLGIRLMKATSRLLHRNIVTGAHAMASVTIRPRNPDNTANDTRLDAIWHDFCGLSSVRRSNVITRDCMSRMRSSAFQERF